MERAWQLQLDVRGRDPGSTLPSSIPILFFGDFDAYVASTTRIVTVGLNPSRHEFPDGRPWSRFPGAGPHLDGRRGPRPAGIDGYFDVLAAYFRRNPYKAWFSAYEGVLGGMDASYYPGRRLTALHTDIASPVATDPTWSKLSTQQRALHVDGAGLWRDLIDVLMPDVIIASVAAMHLRALASEPAAVWPELTRVRRDPPYVTRVTAIERVYGRSWLVHGRCARTPFGLVSTRQKLLIGRAISRLLAGRSARPRR
jgi:hypothetical protein